MPLFIAVHKWKPEDELAITKDFVTGFSAVMEGKFPDVKLIATYSLAQGAYCVWEALNLKALENAFEQAAPTLKKFSEFIPVMQSYPPTMEHVISLYQLMIKAWPSK